MPTYNEINTIDELWKYKRPLQKAIQAAAINALNHPKWGWASLDQIIQDCRDAGEGFDIDILCPAEQSIGIPSSGEYEGWTSSVGPEVHHLLYLWSMDGLLELKEIYDQISFVNGCRAAQNPELTG